MSDVTTFPIKKTVDEAANFKRIRQFDDDYCPANGESVVRLLGSDGEEVGLFGGASYIFLLCKIQILNDQIVLRNVLEILAGKEHILWFINLKLETEQFLMFCVYFLFGKAATPELADLYLESENDHTVLPPLQNYVLGHSTFWEL